MKKEINAAQMKLYIAISGADPGGLWGLETPLGLQKYIKEAKRMMYWYKNTLKHIIS